MEAKEVKKLKSWFVAQQRDLPWRDNPTPYAVWVSEVMLQQTQVAVVIPYFLRWMEKYPTIEALAKAPIEDVIKEWEGLGYYARARNLHEGARHVVAKYAGILPSDEEQLQEIKGLGPYTIGAILSFAFHQKAAAVDGNVMRVLSRYYCIENDIRESQTLTIMQHLTYELLPDKEPWVVSEALIELGATVCMKVPKCGICPLNSSCRGFALGKAEEFPIKSAKVPTTFLVRTVAVMVCGDHILVGKKENGVVMAGLYQFPFFEQDVTGVGKNEGKDNGENFDPEKYLTLIRNELKLDVKWQETLPQVRHSFTRYRALLLPQLFKAQGLVKVEGYEWHTFEAVAKLPFSSGHRRILENVRISM